MECCTCMFSCIMYIHVHSPLHIPLTQDGATPLYSASHNGHHDVVKILLRNGADINQALNVWRYIYHTLILYNCRWFSHKAYRSMNVRSATYINLVIVANIVQICACRAYTLLYMYKISNSAYLHAMCFPI